MSTNIGKLFCWDGFFNSMKGVPTEIEQELGDGFIHAPLARLF